MGELTTLDNERYDRIVALIRNEIVGARPAVVSGVVGGLQVLVLCAVVDGQLTDDGKDQVAAEAILLDGDIADELVLDLDPGIAWQVSNG